MKITRLGHIVAFSHAHGDHLGNSFAICRQTGGSVEI